MRFRTRSAAARYSARCRWRAADERAHAERDAGITEQPPRSDARQPCVIDLRGAGGPLLRLEPRLGYLAWRQRDEGGSITRCAALKTLLHELADSLPRTMGNRHLA